MSKLHGVSLRRTRVYPLFAQGLMTGEVVKQLCMRYHKEATHDEVRTAYFPKQGRFVLKPEELEGASREMLNSKLEHLRENQRRQREIVREICSRPGFLESQSERMKLRWNDPDFVEKQDNARKKLLESHEFKKKQASAASLALKELWKDPEFAEKRKKESSDNIRKLKGNPDFVKKQSDATKKHLVKQWQDPAYRKKMGSVARRLWKNPEYRRKMLELLQDQEFRDASRERLKTLKQAPEFIAKWLDGQARFWQDYHERKACKSSHIHGKEFGWVEGKLVPVVAKPESAIMALMLRKDLESAMGRLTPLQKAALSDAYCIDIQFDPSVLEGVCKKDMEKAAREAMAILKKDKALLKIYGEISGKLDGHKVIKQVRM